MKRQQRKKFPKMLGDRTKCGLSVLICVVLITIMIVVSVYLIISSKVDESHDESGEMMLPVSQRSWEPRCSAQLAKEDRYDCYPEPGGNEQKCQERGCCWKPLLNKLKSIPRGHHLADIKTEHEIISKVNYALNEDPDESIPACVYPDNYGYVLSGVEKQFMNGFEMPLARLQTPARYGMEANEVRVRVEMQTPTRLRIKVR